MEFLGTMFEFFFLRLCSKKSLERKTNIFEKKLVRKNIIFEKKHCSKKSLFEKIFFEKKILLFSKVITFNPENRNQTVAIQVNYRFTIKAQPQKTEQEKLRHTSANLPHPVHNLSKLCENICGYTVTTCRIALTTCYAVYYAFKLIAYLITSPMDIKHLPVWCVLWNCFNDIDILYCVWVYNFFLLLFSSSCAVLLSSRNCGHHNG